MIPFHRYIKSDIELEMIIQLLLAILAFQIHRNILISISISLTRISKKNKQIKHWKCELR